jgi:RND superfamily putative drug exporter
MDGWTAGIQRRRYPVVVAWIALVAVALAAQYGGFGPKLSDLLSNRFDLPGTESARALAILQKNFHERDDSSFTVVFQPTGSVPVNRAAALQSLETQAHTLGKGVIGPLRTTRDGVLYATIGTTLAPDKAQELVPKIRAARPNIPGVRTYLTGTVAVNKDLQPVFDHDLQRGEFLIALPVATLVLLFIFGTAAATVVPLIMALATVPTTLGIVWAIANFLSMAIYVQQLVSLIGIAIAIDYSLLIVYRYREELIRTPDDAPLALRTTMNTAGRAVLFSGVTVAIGLALLVLLPLPFIRSMGIGGVLIPLVSVAAAMTLLPAVLAIMGTGVNRFRVVPRSVIERRKNSDTGVWARLAQTIMKRPKLIAVIVSAVLIASAIPAVFLSLTPGSSKGLPPQSEAVQGLKVLEARLGPGTLSPAIVVVDSGRAGGAATELPAVERLAREVRADPEVASVQSPTPAKTAYLVDRSGRYLRMIIATKTDYGTDQAKKFTGRLRGTYIPDARFGDAVVLAGGGPPTGVDFIDRAYSLFPWLVLTVLILTYIVLLRAFRSVVLPLKAVLLNVLSITATYGILVITFKWGAGQAIGLTQSNQIEAWIPIFLFAMLFGLSMDYEVFLLSRMREIYDETGDTNLAVTQGLEKTGRIVTAAAAIMVAAFSGFVVGSLLGLQEFGWGLAIAIAIDATVIRALLVPALMAIMGDWNWYLPTWAARAARIVPPQPAPSESGD